MKPSTIRMYLRCQAFRPYASSSPYASTVTFVMSFLISSMILSLPKGFVMRSHDSVMLFQKKYWSCGHNFRLNPANTYRLPRTSASTTSIEIDFFRPFRLRVNVRLCIQASGERGEKFKATTLKLLSGFIAESQVLGGTLLDQFWVVVRECHSQLEENVKILQHTEFSSSHHSETVLFEGVDRETINLHLILQKPFTHLGVAFMNPRSGGRKSGSGTPFSVNDLLAEDTDELLRMAASEGFGIRKQAALKALLFKRDGKSCPLTGAPFNTKDGVDPILAHIIPDSVHDKPDTIECIAMLAGTAVRDRVLEQLNDLGNLVNLESNGHIAYDNIRWGIEARNEDGTVKYIYRRVPYSLAKGPGFIRFCDGDQVVFGGGPEAARLGSRPSPLLCNLQFAVARVLRMSGAAEVVAQMIEDGDDSYFPHIYIASPAFCNILTAQLQIAGGIVL